jgi:hypothetical protein
MKSEVGDGKVAFVLRRAQHERETFNAFNILSVRPEPVEG